MSISHEHRLPFAPTPDLRSVQISAGTCSSFASSQVPPEMWAELPVERPQVLLGFLSDYKRLLEAVRRGMYNPESVEHAVVLLLQCGDAPLTGSFRQELWNAFLVPVYQVFVSPTGTLLCWECELQQGWHLEPGLTASNSSGELLLDNRKGERFQTGLAARVEPEPCHCARPGQRLTGVSALKPYSNRRRFEFAA